MVAMLVVRNAFFFYTFWRQRFLFIPYDSKSRTGANSGSAKNLHSNCSGSAADGACGVPWKADHLRGGEQTKFSTVTNRVFLLPPDWTNPSTKSNKVHIWDILTTKQTPNKLEESHHSVLVRFFPTKSRRRTERSAQYHAIGVLWSPRSIAESFFSNAGQSRIILGLACKSLILHAESCFLSLIGKAHQTFARIAKHHKPRCVLIKITTRLLCCPLSNHVN